MSPFASYAVLGYTILSPGVWKNAISMFCEWNGPPRFPPPTGPRITMGIGPAPRYNEVAM